MFQTGLRLHRQYFFHPVSVLVWAGLCDHVWVCDHLAAGLKKNAPHNCLCEQAGDSDLGNYLGRLIFGEKITWNMLVGACVIFLGIYFVTTQEEPSEKVRKETEEHRKKAGQIQKEKEDRYHE